MAAGAAVRHGGTAVFGIGAVALAAAAMPVLSAATGRLVFTLPGGAFAVFLLLLRLGARAAEQPSRRATAAARGATLFFALLCVGFYLVCRLAFFTAGWGFLSGFLPAWPLTAAAARRLRTGRRLTLRTALRIMAAFTLYFGASALVVLWRTG
jgi:hypothetical protein